MISIPQSSTASQSSSDSFSIDKLRPAPKDPLENIQYRRLVLEYARTSEDAKRVILWRAKNDLIWWVDTFAFTYDPRIPKCSALPFISYGFQEEALLRIDGAMGQDEDDAHNLLIEKSRDMGASWMCCMVMEHRWLFTARPAFLMVSRVEDLVDKKNDPDCLFWKLDFLLANLPGFMVPNYERQKLSLTNLDMGGTITGSSTTSETSRGGRKTAILFDEFAAVTEGHAMLRASRDATRCRIFNSTPQGTGNAFYDIREKLLKIDKVLRLHWTLHPKKARGLYHVEGKPHSPWYDEQCAIAAHPTEIAQELDIDYVNSAWQFFETSTIEAIVAKHAKKPYLTIPARELAAKLGLRGEIASKLRDPLELWAYHDAQDKWQSDRDFAIAGDIATGKDGSMSSQSVLSIGDRLTGEKIGMLCVRNLFPQELAEVAVGLCKWFAGAHGGALLGWEVNGPGGEFGKQVIDLGYRHLYYRSTENTVTRRRTELVGWWSNRETKRLLLSQYATALTTNVFINRSAAALRETLEYIHDPSGEVRHAKQQAMKDVDPTATGENHGDMVIADALLALLLKDKPTKQQSATRRVPSNSYAGRMLERVRRRKERNTDRMFEDSRHAA